MIINGMAWPYFKNCTKSFFWTHTYQKTVILSGVYLHLSHRRLQQLDRVGWRPWASRPSCDQSIGKRSGWGAPSYGLSGSHRSSQSAASEKVVLVNKLSIQRVLSWKSQYRNYVLPQRVFNTALKKATTRTDHSSWLISRRNCVLLELV